MCVCVCAYDFLSDVGELVSVMVNSSLFSFRHTTIQPGICDVNWIH